MKVKLIYNSKFAKLINVGAITLYPFIFFSMSKEEALKKRVVHHEWVHVRQVRKLGWFRFYLSYFWQWIKGLFSRDRITYPNTRTQVDNVLERAYYSITYEWEAYMQEKSLQFTEEELKEVG
jgi:hypothetical protein